MTLAQLRALLAVADHGSFTLAAERIGSTQPAVSRVISAVERELGATLFTRHRDGTVPTEAGAAAIAHARAALTHLDRLREDVAATAGRVSGTLRIASLPSATGALLAKPLRAFTARHPAVTVRLFEGTDQEVRDWLANGAADLGVVTLPAPDLHAVVLGGDEMLVVAGAGDEPAVTFAQLAGKPFILPTGGCGPLILEAARRAGVTLEIAFEAREPQSLLEMVAAGLGVTVMPALNVPDAPEGVAVRPLEPRLPRTLALALGSSAGSAAEAFLAALPSV
jgi:DNA-binding transcriptional LysR family regulator